MAFVQFSKVSLAFADRDILRELNLNIASGTRAALAGANGAGKTTLMKIIAGIIQADSGERAVQKGTGVSYLPQSGIVHRGKTLREEAEAAFAAITAKLERIDELGRELQKSGGAPEEASRRTALLLEEHHRLGEEVENSGYYRREAAVYTVLKGLGFKESDLGRNTEEFSGGWQMRIALAKILLENPDILLLDEPTNYLDIEARNWLEGWLQSYRGGYLLVSHDRWFLDVTVNEVYELFQGDLKRYAGNYSAYEKTREVELESLLKRYEAQQEEIEKTEALIRRFRYKATKAAFAQELIKRLDKIERIVIPESLKKISIALPPAPHSGRIALILEGITKSYGEIKVLSGIDLTVESGEKLLVAGSNGAGKTTLLRILAGEDQKFEGSVKYGAGISAAYFSQDAAESLSGAVSVLEYLEREAPTHLIPRLRDMLGAFLFRGDDVYKSLGVLSGGEKSRLALLRMLLKPHNLLILDEPTNHLDLHSKDILLDCLKAFNGTVIFVSHDRAFMEALSTKTLGLGGGRHRLYYGGYAYYLKRVEEDDNGGEPPGGLFVNKPNYGETVPTALALGDSRGGLPAASPCGEEFTESSSGAVLIKAGQPSPLSAGERRGQEKQKQANIRRLERREAEILAALEELEDEKKRLEAELTRPEVYSVGEKARAVKLKLDETAAASELKSREWESAAEELEKARL